ncbi:MULTISPECIES: hypothetical protein [unclassified Lentimonas]|uniref:tyrosine-type recombinase/integrase n=1 Tax=unclassified Lentimonas TaxID=2630993 RepID=UPI00132374D8|nr:MULTISPECIES: hypothetical protein [unclassified Lentimonas]CAA6680197.1 Unannotated [Lentimonas sp. CC4]CAA6687049.1 Unannotated [Lentimonas sp. CC6]CAA7076177.1 Unannotated [Lentimonas sp. CC4]CAA7171174.1 Unannotated [Lentimonas sp. CC21]CAA7182755.1 Unannotated [Lentimonas sp. CC8]
MARNTEPKIVEIPHPSGNITYKVDATIDGKRTRKSYKTKTEANQALKLIEAELAGISELNAPVMTPLSKSEVRDAEAALQFLQENYPGKSLTWMVREFQKHYVPDLQTKALKEAIDEYEETLKKREVTKKYRDNLMGRLRKLEDWFDCSVDEISGVELSKCFEKFANQQKIGRGTIHHYQAALIGFFNWAKENDRKYFAACDSNPGQSIIVPAKGRKIEHLREILSVDQAKEVIEFAENHKNGEMLTSIALALFAGIRPDRDGEMVRLHEELSKSNNPNSIIDLKNGVINISAYVAKESGARQIDIQPSLRSFLERYPLEQYPIISSKAQSLKSYYSRHYSDFREQCPTKIPHDGLRHSFCSYLATKTRSAYDTAMQAGNSEQILRKHYLKRVTPEDAEKFWTITPSK